MRLTSYNMAVKALNAKGCYADMVDRMWGYMEAGDKENADCVRQKALMLLGLIKTVERWKPTIESGYKYVVEYDYSGATVSSPFLQGDSNINGLKIASQFLSNDTESYVEKLICGVNSHISSNDDILKARLTKINDTSFRLIVLSKSNASGMDSTGSVGSIIGTVTEVVISNNVDFTSVNPLCLTSEQILSVVGKIDELCDCNC